MNELFGLDMDIIMYVTAAIFSIAVAVVGGIALTNRTMFKMGLRNLPRRGLQTGLVVVGLMLATLITTAAFTTGDTVDYSITKAGYDALQRTDLRLAFNGDGGDTASQAVYMPQTGVDALDREFAADPDIEGFIPILFEPVPLVNQRTKLSEPAINIAGIDAGRLGQLGSLRLAGGGTADLASLADTDILLSKTAADDLDARIGDVLTLTTASGTLDVRVAGIVKDELSAGTVGAFDSRRASGAAMTLAAVQAFSGHPRQVNHIGVALRGGVQGSVDRSNAAAERLDAFVQTANGRSLLGIGERPVEVETTKQDAIEAAEATGNMMTTFFVILGLFSVAAGVMLIFMIFVMLAAERKAEMGMARAVGAQRSNLVQSFLSEGMAYNLIAGAVGAAAGVAAAIALVVGFLRWQVGDDFAFVEAHVTARSLIISYCLGASITFLTVAIASIKVSSVNIVAAIRGLEEDGKRSRRRNINWKWVAIGVPAMIVPPLGIWFLLNKGFGISWAWIIGPLGIALGALCILGASSNGSEFLFSFGFSILPLSVAMLAAHYRAPGRLTWTLVGAVLAAYYLAPFSVGEKVLGREMKGDIEMFVVSGVMVAISFTLIIVFNAKLLTGLFQRNATARYRTPIVSGSITLASGAGAFVLGDAADSMGQLLWVVAGLMGIVTAVAFSAARFTHLAPAFKMGVAYPLANRFRTGMTIAMFTMIVFSIVTFSAVNSNFMAATQASDGGWDVVATANRNNPIDPLGIELAGTDVASDIAATARTTTYTGAQQVRLTGDDEWTTYPVLAGDNDFYTLQTSDLATRATGWADDASVLQAVMAGEGALIDETDWGPYSGKPSYTIEDETFDPFDVEMLNPVTGETRTVTVIGELEGQLDAGIIGGVYVNEAVYTEIYGEPAYDRTWVRLHAGVGAKGAAREIEAALVTQGVQADSVRQILDDQAAMDRAFTRMFQGFMALGLLVGITSLGVIAFRSVVERRQQIGMLRAIGYQSGTVALTFVLESGFIAIMGILSGVVGGVIVSRNLFTTGQFAGEGGASFVMPWSEVLAFTAVAFVVSLAMTWWPSRNAANVPVADALRYE